jgi:maltooligosyltrehalose trehalohydrolase
MKTFRVWAPHATSVDLVLENESLPMERGECGWWSVMASHAPAGSRYAFRVNGNGPFPDPRSPWQPDGVHAPSRVLDHEHFPREESSFTPPPLENALLYELHMGTFTKEGTYAAAATHLKHLQELGVTHVELLPIAAFPGTRGWGYDGVSLYAPYAPYGTPDELKEFIQAAHQMGIAVLLDVVYNHLGPDGNYLGQFGPYFTESVHTPWGSAVNLSEAHSNEVRRFFIDNAIMWLRDYRFDGLRLDAVHAMFDWGARHFLEELAEAVDAFAHEYSRKVILIAESDLNNPRLVQSRDRGGYGLHAHWEDDFHHALHAVITGERTGYYEDFGTLEQLAKALTQGYVYDGNYSPHRKRNHGRPPHGVHPRQLIVFAQNHDQIGNRAQGERLSHLAGVAGAKAAAALVFQGEEWAASSPFLYFSDHHDELGRQITIGRRKEFAAFKWKEDEIPDPQAQETFERSKLNWDERTQRPHADILEWHRTLVRLRRKHPATHFRVELNEDLQCLILKRGNLLAAFNFSDSAQKLPAPAGNWRPILCSDQSTAAIDAPLPARATRIFEQELH